MSAEFAGAPTGGVVARDHSPAYVLALLTAVSFFNYLDRMVIAVLVEPIKRDLALSDSQIGLTIGFAFALLYATVGLPLARIADRRSRITLLSVCLAAWSAMTALTGLVRNFAELFAVRMAVGIGEAGCAPAAHSILGDLYPRERRAFAISVFQAGGLCGQSIGLALAGIIAQVWGWRVALMAVGLLGVPLALLIYLTVREPPRAKGHAEASAESIMTTLRALLGRPPLVHLVLGFTIGGFGTYGLVQWIPAFFMRSYGLSIAEAGAYIGAAKGTSLVLGTIVGGYALTRLGRRDLRWELWWPMSTSALAPAFYIVSFSVHSWEIALGFQMVAGFIVAMGAGVAFSAVQTYAEPHRRATALAIVLLLSSLLGFGAGPVFIGVVSDLLAPASGTDSLRYALMVSSLIPLWGALHFWLASRSAKPWSLS